MYRNRGKCVANNMEKIIYLLRSDAWLLSKQIVDSDRRSQLPMRWKSVLCIQLFVSFRAIIVDGKFGPPKISNYFVLTWNWSDFTGDTSQLFSVSKVNQFNCLMTECWIKGIIIIWCHNCDQFWNEYEKRLSILCRTHKVTTANFACIINLNLSHSVQQYLLRLTIASLTAQKKSFTKVCFSLFFFSYFYSTMC